MSGLHIRPAVAADLADVVALLAECALPTADLTSEALPSFLVASVEDNVALCGLVGVEPYGEVGLLRSLAVRPTGRGQGMASALVNAVETRAREQGIEDLFLLTTTAEGYFAARGYEDVERSTVPKAIRETTEFRDLCPDSAIVMKKALRDG